VVVRAPTLKEALQEARVRYGEDVRIVNSRNRIVRQEDGLGQEKAVEVVVQPPGESPVLEAVSPNVGGEVPTRSPKLAAVIDQEVTRIERLVRKLAQRRQRRLPLVQELADYPLAATLLKAGTSEETVRQLGHLFAAEQDRAEGDLQAALAHLRAHLRASNGRWEDFGGCHVFLGDSGAGKSDLVLGIAAGLQEAGRRTLVLNLLPKHGGEVRRLQLAAAQHSYDAAIIKRGEQLDQVIEHLAQYEAVLIDTPSLFSPSLAAAGNLQRFIAQNETFHRHCVVPLDLDLHDGGQLWEAARIWNCDWAAVTKLDRSRNRGKLLDLQSRLQLPFSVCTAGPWPESEPVLAQTDEIVALISGEQDHRTAAAARA
jgi:hypothetical protein